ncbi:MAG: aldo/keto reductase [Ruminococcaceae bacterium]|nr:aldo/keto reductase [Oscillospiraceae bacterium]
MSYLGENIKKLGFGLMRLPMIDKEVDIEQMKEMVDRFMEAGFTYFDTAYGYIGGKSELAIAETLVKRYPRESFQLATKLPPWAGARTAEEARQMFWTSLERTGAGYFDFYLLHNLGNDRTQQFEEFDLWNFTREQRAKGLIKHLGFSFHDTAEKLDEILTRHPDMEFVQLQINYADWESSSVQSRLCYETARRHGKPVIIMEPVKGGNLANLPEPAGSIFREANPNASLPSWALRYAASLDGIITVLSGMSNIAQMEDNISTMRDFQPLSDEERAVVGRVQEALARIARIPCTSCNYCAKGCPQNIPIPEVFRIINDLRTYNNLAGARSGYSWNTRNGNKASLCVECGQCELACPQHISIIEELRMAVNTLEK